jgi:DNA-binding MarR family transcriptional regulator
MHSSVGYADAPPKTPQLTTVKAQDSTPATSGDANAHGQPRRGVDHDGTEIATPTPDEYRSAAALRAGLRRFSHASDEVLRGYGLTNERYELLLAIKDLAQRGIPATVSTLTEALGGAQVSVTQLVRRAEDAGLLERAVAPDDARIRHLHLTRHGSRQLQTALTALAEERSRLTSILSELSG